MMSQLYKVIQLILRGRAKNAERRWLWVQGHLAQQTRVGIRLKIRGLRAVSYSLIPTHGTSCTLMSEYQWPEERLKN